LATKPGPVADGTYRFDYDYNARTLNGAPWNPQPDARTPTWALRSACADKGCVATASELANGGVAVIFDFMDGRWVAINKTADNTCTDGTTAPTFEMWSLEPHPDGTLSGIMSDVLFGGSCPEVVRTPVTLTRTGDAAPGVVDPASVPPRGPAAPEAFRGRYTRTNTPLDGGDVGKTQTSDVRTLCVRNTTDCVTVLTATASTAKYNTIAWEFTGGRWTSASDYACSADGSAHQISLLEFPLPQPTPNPITALNGTLKITYTGDCANANHNWGELMTRVGD
jgi:hypothetical protein